jgi:phosphate-selective porin
LQLGQFKTPYGYEQLLPDTKVAMVERSLPNDQMTLSRQIGAMLAGSVLDKRLSYAAGLYNGTGVNNGGNDNEQFLYVGRVAGTVFANKQVKANLGVAGFTTYDTGTFTGHRTGRTAEAQLFCGGAEINAELFRTHFNRDVGVDYNAQGWAVLGSYFFVPNKWQALFRYESYDPNLTITTDKTSLRTIGLNYYIKGDDLKLSLNYLIGNPPGAKKHQDRLTGRMQVIF